MWVLFKVWKGILDEEQFHSDMLAIYGAVKYEVQEQFSIFHVWVAT